MSSENKENGFTTLGATFDESTNANVELPPQSTTGRENHLFFHLFVEEDVNGDIHTDDNGITCMVLVFAFCWE